MEFPPSSLHRGEGEIAAADQADGRHGAAQGDDPHGALLRLGVMRLAAGDPAEDADGGGDAADEGEDLPEVGEELVEEIHVRVFPSCTWRRPCGFGAGLGPASRVRYLIRLGLPRRGSPT